jgi:deazaflavin-dependent oxidoreductase (nitroreductase family)
MFDYLKLADRMWPVLGPLMRGHARLYRATGGRVGGSLPGLPPLLLLEHVGARSGRRRTTPLVYMPDGENLIVVPSKGGHPRNPGWLHNLRARPETEVQIGRRRIPVRAREASDEEHRSLWPRAIEHNPRWGQYQERTEREIPLVILEPQGRDSQTRPSRSGPSSPSTLRPGPPPRSSK